MDENDTIGRRPDPVSIAIVGLGVRGLSVLERLISHAAGVDPKLKMLVHLVDAEPAQPGQYASDQPDYLLLNHACGHVSMFPAPQSVPRSSALRGPTLFEWVREQQVRIGRDGFTAGASGRQVRPNDNLPRRVFGEYLMWFLEHLRGEAPENVELVDHLSNAVDLNDKGDASVLYLDNGETLEANYVFVTVGQGPSEASNDGEDRSGRLIREPYPLPDQLASVQPSDTVAVVGLGLTATDAILALTVGRGGSFDQSASPQRYVPSGLEPRIIVFSRSGLPYRARPAPSSCVAYEPVAFCRSAIDALRADTPRLDFDRDLLPLLLLELRVAYRRATLLQAAGPEEAEAFLVRARAAAAEGRLQTDIELPGPAEFDAEAVYHGQLTVRTQASAALTTGAAYQRAIESWMADDLVEATRGFEASPFKAATEVARELRDHIRYAVEFGGLTDASLDRFFGYHVEAINRLVIGPEKERSANILALLHSGAVSMHLGPNPHVSWDAGSRRWTLSSTALSEGVGERAFWLYRGYIDRLRTLEDDAGLVGAMARRGTVRRFRPDSTVVRSVDVDEQGHPVAATGTPATRTWIFGLLCEGPTFYNGYLTSPGRFERAQYDADRAVHELFEDVRSERRPGAAHDGGDIVDH